MMIGADIIPKLGDDGISRISGVTPNGNNANITPKATTVTLDDSGPIMTVTTPRELMLPQFTTSDSAEQNQLPPNNQELTKLSSEIKKLKTQSDSKDRVGTIVGVFAGTIVGTVVGDKLGIKVGFIVGNVVGCIVGVSVGEIVGNR